MSDPELAPALAADGTALPVSEPTAGVVVSAAPLEPETPLAATEPPKTDAIVDLWFAECVQNTPVGRYTDAYNAIYAAKDELKRRLNQEK